MMNKQIKNLVLGVLVVAAVSATQVAAARENVMPEIVKQGKVSISKKSLSQFSMVEKEYGAIKDLSQSKLKAHAKSLKTLINKIKDRHAAIKDFSESHLSQLSGDTKVNMADKFKGYLDATHEDSDALAKRVELLEKIDGLIE